jgi:murein L,D-transpeptidase YafK
VARPILIAIGLALGVFGFAAWRFSGAKSHVPVKPAASARMVKVCASAGVPYPPKSIFIRAFKAEKEMEIWGADAKGVMHLLRTYPIAAASGEPGPKRQEGDYQVPEGVYRVAVFNPHSRFHLSLGLNYPNKADRVLGDRRPGTDIYIHGNRVSAGCLAMTDKKIEEIYALATHARRVIPVHVFPCRMGGSVYAQLKQANPQHVSFWKELEPIYRAFEAGHRVPAVAITRSGRYMLKL